LTRLPGLYLADEADELALEVLHLLLQLRIYLLLLSSGPLELLGRLAPADLRVKVQHSLLFPLFCFLSLLIPLVPRRELDDDGVELGAEVVFLELGVPELATPLHRNLLHSSFEAAAVILE